MPDPATDATRALELERAWQRECLQREKAHSYIAILAAVVLVPSWIPVDYFLAPAWLYPFMVLRLFDVGVSAVLLTALWRSTDIDNIRIYGAIKMISTGVAIAVMLPALDAYYYAYVLGFSLVFWGAGIIYVWPVRISIFTFVPIMIAHGGLHLFSYRGIDIANFVGATFYLGSAAVLASGIIFMRRQLLRRAFRSAFDLENSHRELEQTLATLTETQEQLIKSEKLSALGRLLAQLSHEINNPINVIHNNLTPLAEYWRDAGRVLDAYGAHESALGEAAGELARLREEVDLDYLREDFPAAHEAMTEAVQRIRTIHDNLRTFIRGGTTELGEVDINAGVEATIQMLDRGLPEGVRIETDLGELPGLRFKPGEINQVFFNLLQNAVDAVSDAGTIRVETRMADRHVRIEVSDTGTGIPEEIRGRIFEPFFTTKGVAEGTGLGLAICYQIVDDHGGTIRLDNREVGTCFVVELPFDRDSTSTKSAGAAPQL